MSQQQKSERLIAGKLDASEAVIQQVNAEGMLWRGDSPTQRPAAAAACRSARTGTMLVTTSEVCRDLP